MRSPTRTSNQTMIIFDRQPATDPGIEVIRLERKFQLGPYRKPSVVKSEAEAPERQPSVAQPETDSGRSLGRLRLATLAAA